MYSRLVIWLWAASGVSSLFIVATVLIGIAAITMGIIWLFKKFSTFETDEDGEQAARRGTMVLWSVFGVVLLITCFLPNQQGVLTFAAMRAVDDYNARHVSSYLQPEGIIQTADELIGVVNQAIEKANSVLSR